HPPPTPLPPLSLHDALPIYLPPAPDADDASGRRERLEVRREVLVREHLDDHVDPVPAHERHGAREVVLLLVVGDEVRAVLLHELDRKSTRLNSSHVSISYAV